MAECEPTIEKMADTPMSTLEVTVAELMSAAGSGAGENRAGREDCFIIKVDSDGARIVYSTLLGGKDSGRAPGEADKG